MRSRPMGGPTEIGPIPTGDGIAGTLGGGTSGAGTISG